MNDEYHIFEVIDSMDGKTVLPITSECTLYISKDVFDCQVACGQETSEKVKKQINLDVTRSKVCVFGERVFAFPEYLTILVARYCTQAVMAYPVEVLSSLGLVAECKKARPMCVDVWGEHVHAQKPLRCYTGDRWVPVTILVTADMQDPCVLVKVSMQP